MGLEAAIVTLLAPVLPALIGAGKAVGQEAATAIGAEAADLGRRVWERLKGSLADRPLAKAATDVLAADPDSKSGRDTLRTQLEELLATDPELKAALTTLVKEGENRGVFADRGAVVYEGNVSVSGGGIFIGRDARDVRKSG